MNDLRLPSETLVSQATQVEQSRAVAEVQAAVTVAQSVPRDQGRAEAEMIDTCRRKAVADQAFYSVPKRGTGPTVHLARELARIWGNVDYGVRELRRDDEAGESEIQAYAWDQQGNVRSTRSFIVPHARMAKGKRNRLEDLGDIYLNNQNQGARAVRECIFTVLPSWFITHAQQMCENTLAQGEGEPLEDRIEKMVRAFDPLGVSLGMLETKLGRPRTGFTAGDLKELGIAYGTLKRGEASARDLFPEDPASISAQELTGQTVVVDQSTGELQSNTQEGA